MIFTPFSDESKVIGMIHKVRNEAYALLRLTFTMIDKNNLDANGILRDLLLQYKIVDYEQLEHGGKHGITSKALFIQAGKTEKVDLRFYRVTNSRGDRRFSIETIKKRTQNKEINEGDLLYISVYKKPNGEPQIYIINLTHNIPTEEELVSALGVDNVNMVFNEVKQRLKNIVDGGYYPNVKGKGKIAPKDVGDTLESLLEVPTNNSPAADIRGVIELKSKGGNTLDTLFTLRPSFEGTPVEEYEENDRYRVSAFARLYGYISAAHPESRSLYITIGSKESPQNNQGFYLEVEDNERKVNLMKMSPDTGRAYVSAYWRFGELKRQLETKHPATLWIKADIKEIDGTSYFKYKNEFEFSRSPQFTTFLSLIKLGIVTYDWRGYTTAEGKYVGKNHGNAWRIKPSHKAELFGEIEVIRL